MKTPLQELIEWLDKHGDMRIYGGRELTISEIKTKAKSLLEKEVTKKDAEFIWSILPNWLHDHPKGLDPSFYGTGTREGDIKVSNKVKRILNL